jgi:hypothetical protein
VDFGILANLESRTCEISVKWREIAEAQVSSRRADRNQFGQVPKLRRACLLWERIHEMHLT